MCSHISTTAFDIDKVAERSLVVKWIKDCKEVMQMHRVLDQERKKIDILPEENFPLQSDMLG